LAEALYNLAAEREDGNLEYKLKIDLISEARLEELATQMKYRLMEGGGEAFYELGVSNDGSLIGISEEELADSLKNLERIAEKIGARIIPVRTIAGRRGKIEEVLVRRSRAADYPISVYVSVLGNADAGKSTLISVLTTGELDDGNGKAMSRICRYLHELEMRRTSSVSTHLLGYDEQGNVVNYDLSNPSSEADVYLESAKIITLVDLAGHERYLRTTLKGVMGYVPDYALIAVSGSTELPSMAKEHMGLAVSLRVPFFIAVTKVDIAPKEVLEQTIKDVQKVLKIPNVNKIPVLIRDIDDIVVCARHISSGRIVPIFPISSTTGEGLEKLILFLNLLPPVYRWRDRLQEDFLMYVDDKFNVPGVGAVVSGLVLQGSCTAGAELAIGPFPDSRFRDVRVRSIQVNRVFIERVIPGQEVTFALSGVKFEEIRKGMAIVGRKDISKPRWSFMADVHLLHHPTTIKTGYHATFHIQTIRQAARFEWLSKEPLRSNDRATARIRFLFRPEHVMKGQQFVFREGRTRGIGIITSVE
jgi:elongation factor 1-alpha